MSGSHNESNCGCNNNSNANAQSEIVKLTMGAAVFTAAVALPYLANAVVQNANDEFTANVIAQVQFALYMASYLILGAEIILRALKNIARGKVFDENFLMGAATLGAIAIGEYPEAVTVMLFYQIGEYFQELAVRRSKKSIADLMDIRPDYANVVRGDDIVKVDPNSVRVGDNIVVKPGEKIPLDGVVLSGESMIDTSALTGESVPRRAAAGAAVLSGCINQTGVIAVRVTKTFGESTAAKIIDLVENASAKKAPTEKFITIFSRIYTPIVVLLAAFIAIFPPIYMSGAFSFSHEWIHRGLVFLVISCPCALVISIPLSFFGGIGGASKRGILVKGGNYLEALAALDIVVFDKTGTLTKGVFAVNDVRPANNFSVDDLMTFAAAAESFSNHPIAISIINKFNADDGILDKSKLSEYKEIAGHGVSVIYDGKKILAGNKKLMDENDIVITDTNNNVNIGTTIFIAVDKNFAGTILISDEIKPDSRNAIIALKSRGVRKVVMLTGDNKNIAAAVAKELSIDEVYSELLPHQKVEAIEKLDSQKSPKKKIAFVGDGINDAPVLARADVGVAMGGLGSDAAIEAADVVLMTDEPQKLAAAIDVARFTKNIVTQNIVFALGSKVIFLYLGALGVAGMWEAVFADVGVALLAVLNASRVGRDRNKGNKNNRDNKDSNDNNERAAS